MAEPIDQRLSDLQAADRDLGARFCRTCGCTDVYGCDGGCSWVDEDLCSLCAEAAASVADPGIDLPAYPALPLENGEPVLDQLEAWQAECRRVELELDGAWVAALTPDSAKRDDSTAVATRMAEFAIARQHDTFVVFGFLSSRATNLVKQAATTGATFDPLGYVDGVNAGLAASARRLEALGLVDEAKVLRAATLHSVVLREAS